MRVPVLAVAIAAAASLAIADAPRRPKTNHPVLGTWVLAVPETDCEETYYVRQDGTTLVTSGQEVAESVYEIDDEPSAKGYYKNTVRITKDNGKPDCAGDITRVGTEVTHYMRFYPSWKIMFICMDESGEACIGPLYRLGGERA